MKTIARPTRIAASLVAALALSLTGLAAAPVQAEPIGSITTIHFKNAKGQPISGLDVMAVQGDYTPEDFTATSTVGDYQATNLYPGNWTLYAFDSAVARANQTYVNAETNFTINEDGNGQDLGSITMQLGAVVTGKVTAPSGHALKNVQVTIEPVKASSTNYGSQAVVNSVGVFRAVGLKAGTYKLSYMVAYEYKMHVVAGTFTLTTAQVATARNIKKVKVPASMSVVGKSTKKKKATITVKANGARYGITDPRGTVTVKEGKKTKKSKVRIVRGKATINLTKLKKGKHTFTVSYVGGDLLNVSKKVTVKVK